MSRFVSAMFLLAPVSPVLAGSIQRVNVDPATQTQADAASSAPALSADGSVVAFLSGATNLIAGYGLTSASPQQVYAYDRIANAIEIVSVANDNAIADGPCVKPLVSADGRYVAFLSGADNLPAAGSGASGGGGTIYIRDRQSHTTFMPMRDWLPAQPSITGAVDTSYLHHYMNADASLLVFNYSSLALAHNVYTIQASAGASALLAACPAADGDGCQGPAISADGSTIAFTAADALVGGDTNGHADVYAYDVAAQTYTRVSIDADGITQGNADVSPGDIALSADGKLVAFSSGSADNLGGFGLPNLLLVKNLASGALVLASMNDDGTPGYVGHPAPTLSADGSRVTFTSNNLALAPHPGKTASDALVRDMSTGHLFSVCQADSGTYGDNDCSDATLSSDGHWAAFTSTATNLVANDTNGQADIFLVALDTRADTIFVYGFEL